MTLKTIEQMQVILRELGLKKLYRPSCEPETGVILIGTRKPAKIIAGELSGTEIALCGSEFKVWTSQKKKARAVAVKHGLKVRLLDGEAELMVPASLADLILPLFGAKVRRELSPEQLAAARLWMQQVRNSPNFKVNPDKKGVPGSQNVDPASLPLPELKHPFGCSQSGDISEILKMS